VISWDDYFKRIVGLRLQFDLARKAIASFSTTREALESYATSDLEDFRHTIAEVLKRAVQIRRQHGHTRMLGYSSSWSLRNKTQ